MKRRPHNQVDYRPKLRLNPFGLWEVSFCCITPTKAEKKLLRKAKRWVKDKNKEIKKSTLHRQGTSITLSRRAMALSLNARERALKC